MSKKTEQARFTKVATDLLVGVKDLVNWGMDTGNTTPGLMTYAIAEDRRLHAIKLIEAGVSQRQAAKMLNVAHTTIARDVRGTNMPRGGTNAPAAKTGSAKTKAHRAATTARASGGGVTPAPTDKYRIFYADCPWDYGAHAQPDYHTEQRDHYAVMPLDELCALPVEDWAEEDAVLFFWVTSPILEKSFQVIRAWGFEYKASFVWDKIKHNMGHYNSVRHELLLVCTRGACQPDVKQLFDSVQSIERSDKHSQKPVEFYDIIETLYTHGRRLELFAREKRDGWDVYAHQAELQIAAE